jgi:signal transduction histidine kinase/ActR/RegA family two-component response regulator
LLDTLPSTDRVDEADVLLEKSRLLFRNAGMAQTVVVMNAAVLVGVFGGMRPPLWAMVWWLAVLLVSALRYRLARRFLACNPDAAAIPPWRNHAIFGAMAAGTVWAVGGSAMMMADPDSTRLFATLVMAGQVSGAVPILSSVPMAYRVYAAPLMAAVILTAVLDAHGARDFMLALVATFYLFLMMFSSRYFHGSLDRSIRLALRMRRMAEQLEQARRGAEAASTAKSQFLAMMSHEIRTPMNGILGMAQVLLRPGLSEDERQEFTTTILNSGQSLLTLLNDILDLSKVEAGKMELSRVCCDPSKMVGDTAALFAESASRKGLRLEAEWHGDASARYLSDNNRIRQMLSNLVNNAIKFTATGFVRIDACETAHDKEEAELEFSVSDSGMGITAEKQILLFQPFVQVDSTDTRQFGGTGLGLSIVRLLSKLMGGEAGVESTPDHGSRFWFRVRVGIAPAAVLQATAAAKGPSAARNVTTQTRRIAVVEDNPVNRRVVGAMLARRDFEIEFFENGRLAVEALIEGTSPDIVLMDCQMPIMDGYEATRRIRQWEQARGQARLPIIALTASAFDDDHNHCIAVGMDDYLTKPLKMEELDAMLAKWMGRPRGELAEDGRLQSPAEETTT